MQTALPFLRIFYSGLTVYRSTALFGKLHCALTLANAHFYLKLSVATTAKVEPTVFLRHNNDTWKSWLIIKKRS